MSVNLKGYDHMGKKMMKQNKGWTVLFGILFLILIISSFYMLFSIALLSNIENKLRFIVACIVIVLVLVLILLSIRSVIKGKHKQRFLYSFLILVFSVVFFFVASNIHTVINKLGNVSTSVTTYSASLITLKNNKAENIRDIGSSEIGLLEDEDSIDGNQIPKQIMKNQKLSNKTIEYEDYISMLNDLYEGKIEYIFLPTGYVIKFSSLDGFENIGTETKILYTEEKDVKNTISKKGNKIEKPFTILLMGVDSELENIKGASFNGDSLMLLTFNPTTLNTTILSIPRDTYVPIACFKGNRKNKITHAAWQGESCMIKTIENMTGITIDYYAKMNFKGVVKLVDALGGIDVDVPIDFCEQDSNRNFENLICLKKGLQTLNGEQALALSRHRKTINDFIRGQNQQLVVKGLMNKAKSISSIDTIYDLLDTVSMNMETNMSTNEILSFYDIAKDILVRSKDANIEELLGMQRLYISGFDATIYDYDANVNQGTKMRLYNFVPYEGSIKDVSNAMKINLGLVQPEIVKTFSFDVDEPYQETIIGKGTYKGTSFQLLPNFVGYNQSKAVDFGQKNGIKINIESISSAQREGQVISQSLPEGMDISAIGKSGITITVSTGKGENINHNDEPKQETLPNFVGKSYQASSIEAFQNQNKKIRFLFVKVSEGEKGYDAKKKGQIISQSVKAGTNLEELEGETITLKYIDDEEIEEPEEKEPEKDPIEEPKQPEEDPKEEEDSDLPPELEP